MNTILVCVDYSDSSKVALQEASRVANATNAALRCVYVLDNDFLESFSLPTSQSKSKIIDGAHQELSDFIASTVGSGKNITAEVVIGPPYEVICQQVQDIRPDLLVIGENSNIQDETSRIGLLSSRCIRDLNVNIYIVKHDLITPYRKIVSCVDFSPNSIDALNIGCEFALICNSEVHIVHIIHAAPTTSKHVSIKDIASLHEQQKGIATSRIQKLTEELEKKYPTLSFSTTVKASKNIAKGLIDEIESNNASLIVMGTNGSKVAPSGAPIGTAAECILKGSSTSIVAVKP